MLQTYFFIVPEYLPIQLHQSDVKMQRFVQFLKIFTQKILIDCVFVHKIS